MGVSLTTLDALMNRANHPIPHIRLGRKVIIPVKGLETWLAEEAERQRYGTAV